MRLNQLKIKRAIACLASIALIQAFYDPLTLAGLAREKESNNCYLLDSSSDPYYFASLAEEREKNKDFAGAISLINCSISLASRLDWLYMKRSNLHLELKMFNAAISDIDKAISLKNDNSYYHYLRGYILYLIEDYPEAIKSLDSAIELNPRDYYSFYLAGSSKHNLKDFSGAARSFTEAISLKPSDAHLYLSRGLSWQEKGEFSKALDDFTSAIKLDPDDDFLYIARSFLYIKLEEYELALADCNSAINVDPNDDYAYSLRASVKSSILDSKGAISDYSIAISINNSKGYYYVNRGYEYAKIGDYRSALKDFDSALVVADSPENFDNIVIYTIWMGKSLNDIFFLPQVQKKLLDLKVYGYSNSLISSETYKSLDAVILYLKSKKYYSTGSYSKAISVSLEALEGLNLEVKVEKNLSIDLKNILISSYIGLRKYDEAKRHIDKKSLQGQLYLAHIAMLNQQLDKAEKIIKRLLKIQEKMEVNNPVLVGLLGSVYWWKGESKKSLPLIKESVSGIEKLYGLNDSSLIQPLINLAMAHYRLQNYGEAERLLRRSLSMQFSRIQEEAIYLPVSQRLDFLSTFGISYAAIFSATNLHPHGKELALWARLNRHGLLEELQKRQQTLAILKGPHESIIDRLKLISSELSSRTGLSEVSRQKLILEQERLEEQLYSLLPQFESKIVQVSDVNDSLPDSSVLIEFQKYKQFQFKNVVDALDVKSWGEDHYQALILPKNGVIISLDLGPAEPIDRLIHDALRASESSMPNALELWQKVGSRVIHPIAKHAVDYKTWFISPDSELNRIPYFALKGPLGGKFLVESVDLRLITTGRELLAKVNAPPVIKNQSLVVADPSFDFKVSGNADMSDVKTLSSGRRSAELQNTIWSPLPGTAKEGRFISELIDAELLLKGEASSLALLSVKSPHILHIASHSYFQPALELDPFDMASHFWSASELNPNQSFENPLLRSGIVLAGANYPDDNPIDDGYVTALEFASMDLNSTQMVVVSGCESGMGDVFAGEGVYGLKRAIAVAGAESTLLSLWKVDDRATAAFMKEFYTLLDNGLAKDKALSLTQSKFRDHPIPLWREPYVWAAFQLSGDPRPISGF
ncbi:CHAT domain-containing protein [bacterium]|nr:CHAT domain-containing protein [bacterium]